MNILFKFVCSAAAITHTHTLSPFVSVCLYVTYQSHTQIHPSHLFRRGQRVGEGVGEKKKRREREISGEGGRRVAGWGWGVREEEEEEERSWERKSRLQSGGGGRGGGWGRTETYKRDWLQKNGGGQLYSKRVRRNKCVCVCLSVNKHWSFTPQQRQERKVPLVQ